MRYETWDAFWTNRGPIPFSEMKPFLHNFYVLHEIVTNHFGLDLRGKKSIEIGAGRGTMSHYFKNYGLDITCLDLKDHLTYSNLKFKAGDVFNLDAEEYDLVFTYGLLEHFTMEEQVDALNRMLHVTKTGGINVHYIVPRKMTNIFEDRNVPRTDCYMLREQFPMLWTFPICNIGSWKSNKWLGKGAFFKLEKENEDVGFSYGKV